MFDAEVAEVKFEYHKNKRIAKLLQIENALTDKNAGKYLKKSKHLLTLVLVNCRQDIHVPGNQHEGVQRHE